MVANPFTSARTAFLASSARLLDVHHPSLEEVVMLNHCLKTRRLAALLLAFSIGAAATVAQTSAFTYQGKLTDGGNPANGTFDLQFTLFEVLNGGAQQGVTLTREDVVVISGVFTVQLDFGAAAFPGAARFLEIGVRPGASTGAFTLLTPRQPVQVTPYALRSLNAGSADALTAACIGCVTGTQIGAGSGNYIQNTTTQQPASDFNISGTGTANIVNATTQFNLNNARVLSNAGTNNLFVGANAGAVNTGGASNVFVGAGTGGNNTTGNLNTFFGRSAGNGNISGASNSFFGSSAGTANTTGGNNTLLGAGANVGAGNLDFATALGAGATVASSNSIVLGRSGGQDAVSVPGALAVAGALTANGAGLTNLNAANLTTGTLDNNRLGIVTTTKGGTGLSAAGAAGNYLRSDGTNWTSAALAAVDIPTGSGNYIQNATAPQAASNFNISGTGTANIVNAATQFNLNGQRILTANSFSFFAGLGAGAVATGGQNTYVGANAGAATTTGNFNSFFGFNAGAATVTEFNNSYFGARAGEISHGFNGAFFGTDAGKVNNTGSNNTFIGAFAGIANSNGNNNVFVGQSAGEANTAGTENVFVGRKAGNTNTTGSDNTIIGTDADVGSNNLSNATALGNQALVTQSNSLVLGSINGVNGAMASTQVGIGTTAPNSTLEVASQGSGGVFFTNYGGALGAALVGNQARGTLAAPTVTQVGDTLATFGATGHTGTNFSPNASGTIKFIATENFSGGSFGTGGGKIAFSTIANTTNLTLERMVIDHDGQVGIGTTGPADLLDVNGDLRVGTSGTNGCLKNNSGGTIIGTCSSDLRFKQNITAFPHVLNKFAQLRPVHYFWRVAEFPAKHFGPEQSYGLIAQEVEQVLPELVSTDVQGYKQVDYSKLPLLTIQAVKELKAENEALKQQHVQQQRLLNVVQGRLQIIERIFASKHYAPRRVARLRHSARQGAF